MSDPSGVWYNELGSKMELVVSGSSVSGTYNTGVGDASGDYALTGGLDPDPNASGSIAIGWAVAWYNTLVGSSNSVTTWCGQYQVIDGEEEIVALWLLTSETVPDQDWESTLVNRDVFTRAKPSPDAIDRNRRRIAASHPVRRLRSR